MPRSERERPPGPFTSADRITLADFTFEAEGRRQLLELLTKASPALGRPCAAPVPANEAALAAAGSAIPETPAEWIIAVTAQQIRLLLSARKADPKAAPGNPANYRAAIRRLRTALKPFVEGWVDPKTALIEDWRAIDAVLAQRDGELARIKRPSAYKYRELQYNLAKIASYAAGHALRAGIKLREDTILRFLHAALSQANIELPHPDEHPARLRKLVFE